MNLLKNTANQLVRRRLWPVAVLLVAALVAVPMTLAKSPEPAAPVAAVPAKSSGDDATIAQPVVQLSETNAGDKRRRRVLGAAKDPFEPAPLPKAKKKKHAKTATTATATATPDAAGGAPSAGGGASAPPSAAPTPAPTTTVPKGSVKVRFGATSLADLPASILGHLDPLPSADAPVLVLERLTDNGKTAVFSIPGEVTAVGDGSCKPTPDDCQTLELKAGETEFITVKNGSEDGTSDAQYELDLVKVFAKATAIPKDSVASGDGTTP